MHFDAALNVVWLVLGMGAFALALRASCRLQSGRKALPLAQFAGVIALAGTLFPYVSATDDLICIEAVSSLTEHAAEHGSGCSRATTSGLLNLLQAQDSFVVGRAVGPSAALIVVGVVDLPVFRSFSRQRAATAGRSPPANLTA